MMPRRTGCAKGFTWLGLILRAERFLFVQSGWGGLFRSAKWLLLCLVFALKRRQRIAEQVHIADVVGG